MKRNNRMGGFVSEKVAIKWAEENLPNNQSFKIEKSGGDSFVVIIWRQNENTNSMPRK